MVNFDNLYADIGQGYYPVDVKVTDDIINIMFQDPGITSLSLAQSHIIAYDDEVGVDIVLLELTFVHIPRLTLKFATAESKQQFISLISQGSTSSDSGKSSDGSSEPEPEGP
ncbi:uncharacterized protein [Euwallacea similis]|uniref:uncharacterized protein n=1 Tax=Euwallacea similis TaxID=1736056 RepID=UPI00344C38F0